MNPISTAAVMAVGMAILAGLLALGRALGPALGLQRLGLPAAVLAGALGLLLGPHGPWPVMPAAIEALWARLPMVLLTLVFGTLMLGRPLPAVRRFWRPAAAQTLLGLTLGFGQYLIGALVVLLVLGPWLGVDPLMACLIEVGFEGGHGSAAVMGPIYAGLGFRDGTDLGLAMATVGLLCSTMMGGLLVVLAQRFGWLLSLEPQPVMLLPAGDPSGAVQLPEALEAHRPSCALPEAETDGAGPASWLVNLGLAGLAVAMGVGMQMLMLHSAAPLNGTWHTVLESMPVYPLALAGSLLVRLSLERSRLESVVCPRQQAEISGLATDLLITAAMAGLDLGQLARHWVPLAVLGIAGLFWNLLVVLVLARRVLPLDWFERAVAEFGQATGVAASGLLLLGMADPDNRSGALPAFSIKQLLLQPVLSGGMVTVAAPLAISRWGLPAWSELCFVLTALWIALAVWLSASQP
jgi:glutamate:Na+ symporter, ESS family